MRPNSIVTEVIYDDKLGKATGVRVRRIGAWLPASGLIVLLVLAPLVSLALAAAQGSPDQPGIAGAVPDQDGDRLYYLADNGTACSNVSAI